MTFNLNAMLNHQVNIVYDYCKIMLLQFHHIPRLRKRVNHSSLTKYKKLLMTDENGLLNWSFWNAFSLTLTAMQETTEILKDYNVVEEIR